jgi:hypothetical protein
VPQIVGVDMGYRKKRVVNEEDQCVEAVGSLLEALGAISDARKAKGVRYPLKGVLALCVLSFLCGRQNLRQVQRFAKLHPHLLTQLGMNRPESPSVPTLSRVLGSVRVSELQKALSCWFAGLVDSIRKRQRCSVAAVDGKTSRACGVHMLNVFLHDVGQVIWQVPVEAKENEISAFKEALAALFAAYPFLRIVTGDAMYAGAPLCSSLIEQGRHYVFQIKADQPHLHEKMGLIFSPRLHGKPRPDAFMGEKKKRLRRST